MMDTIVVTIPDVDSDWFQNEPKTFRASLDHYRSDLHRVVGAPSGEARDEKK